MKLRVLSLIVSLTLLPGCSLYFGTFERPEISTAKKEAFQKPNPPSDAPTGSEAIEPTFVAIREKILVNKCQECHKPGGRADEIPLITYDDLLRPLMVVDLVVPGDPEASLIYKTVQEGAKRFMPPKRSGIPALTTDEMSALREWILRGAQD